MFWVLPIAYSLYEKTILEIFVHLFICEVTTTKVNFRFFKQCSQTTTRLVCERAIFAPSAGIVFLALIFFYTLKKNLVEKLYKVLEMELQTYTPVGPKFVFGKIKFNISHYIQHNFICQRPGLSKDQISLFKSLVIN